MRPPPEPTRREPRRRQVRNIVARVQRGLYALYFAPQSGPGAAIAAARAPRAAGASLAVAAGPLSLRASATRLLNRLFERNCYRAFAPPEAWLAADRYVQTVV